MSLCLRQAIDEEVAFDPATSEIMEIIRQKWRMIRMRPRGRVRVRVGSCPSTDPHLFCRVDSALQDALHGPRQNVEIGAGEEGFSRPDAEVAIVGIHHGAHRVGA